MRKTIKHIVCIFACLVCCFSFAQDLGSLSLEDLHMSKVISASKQTESIHDAPGVINVITSNEIEMFGANNLYEVLERITSVYMTGSNFFPQNILTMRGDQLSHYGNHVLIMINTRPIRESYAGGTNMSIFTAYPLSQIERIEIIRGPGSVLYGTSAYSGIINIITKKEAQEKLNFQAGGGSLATNFTEISTGVKNETFNLQAAGKKFKEDGWLLSAVDNNGVDSSMYYGENNNALTLNSQYKKLTFSSFFTNSAQHFLGSTITWDTEPELENRIIISNRAFGDLTYKNTTKSGWTYTGSLTYNHMDFKLSNYSTYSNDVVADASLQKKFAEKINWLTGVNAWQKYVGSKDGTSTAPVPSFNSLWFAGYTQLDYKPFSFLKLIAGTQFNKPENVKLDIIPRFGVIASLKEKMGLKLLYAQAFRSAFGVETDFNIILYNDDGSIRGGLRGNPELKPEKVTTLDAQLFYYTPSHQFSVTYFNSVHNSLIGRERAADGALDFVNEGTLYSSGIEAEGNVNIKSKVTIIGSASYQQNKNEEGIENFTTVPNFMGKIGAYYLITPDISLGVFNSYIGKAGDVVVRNPDRAEVNPSAEAYNLLSANAKFKVYDSNKEQANSVKIYLSLYSYNLLNESIYQPEFVGRRINTIPSRQPRTAYGKLTITL